MIMEPDILIAGAGGLGRVIHDFLIADNYNVSAFIDDNIELKDKDVCGNLPVIQIEDLKNASRESTQVILGILDPKARVNLVQRIKIYGIKFLTYSARFAFISPYANIGEGSVILNYSFVMNRAVINNYVHVHFHCAIGHDAIIGSYTTFGPSCIIGGGVVIGKGVKLGMGAKVLPGISIGDFAEIGANSLVTKDLPPYSVSYGSPAKVVSFRKE